MQPVRFAGLPFKMPVLIRCVQDGKSKKWQERLEVADRYGYPDILARSEQADYKGKVSKRLGVFELKRPKSVQVELALLQAYGYCCALHVMPEDVKARFFKLCGYKKENNPSKNHEQWLHPHFQIRGFRAIALIDQKDEGKLKNSQYTQIVQLEPRVLAGKDLIGYITYTYQSGQLEWGKPMLWNTEAKEWVSCQDEGAEASAI